MRPKWCVALALVACILVAAYGVYAAGPTRKPATTAKSAVQWEYLVVAEKEPFFAENVLRDSSGNPFRYEAAGLPERMNKLGQQGWELVAVLGSVGGDQEFIFKRRRS